MPERESTNDDLGDEILITDEDGVRTITLNRPDRLNALSPSIMSELVRATTAAAADPAVGCVVLTGAGRGFCAGGDVRQDAAPIVVDPGAGGRVEQGYTRLRGFTESAWQLHEMPKPTIAMINGPVAGAGIGLAGACDLRFAATSATFVSAYDRIGASGDFGATWFWTKILGTAAAREIFFLGQKIEALDALKRGIYTRVFSDETLRSETMTVARELAKGPRMAWRYIKANLNLAEDGSFEAALDHEALNMGLSISASALIRRAGSSKVS